MTGFRRQEIFEPYGIICYNISNIKAENRWEIPALSRICAEAVSAGRTLNVGKDGYAMAGKTPYTVIVADDED